MATKTATKPKAIIAFAAFREEKNKHITPIVVDFGEEQLELPPNMPASVMLDLMAFQQEQTEAGKEADLTDIPVEMAMSIMHAVIGDERLQALIRKYKLDMGDVIWLMQELMAEYMGEVAEQSGNAETAPKSRSTS